MKVYCVLKHGFYSISLEGIYSTENLAKARCRKIAEQYIAKASTTLIKKMDDTECWINDYIRHNLEILTVDLDKDIWISLYAE